MRADLIIIATSAVALSLSLSGCANVGTMVAAKPRVVSREATVGAVGASVKGALADGFPANVVLWPGAEITSSAVAKTPQGENWSATLLTKDAYEPVREGMAVGLQKAGWTVESQNFGTSKDPGSMLTITRSGAEGLVTLSRTAEKRTSIEIDITPKP